MHYIACVCLVPCCVLLGQSLSESTGEYATRICTQRRQRVQIQSSLQHAKMLVHPFPRAADMNQLLDALAQQHKEPSIVSLSEPSDVDDLQHAANWAAVIQCVQSLDEKNVHGHTPLIKDLAGTA